MTTNQAIKILRTLYPHRRIYYAQFDLWAKMGIIRKNGKRGKPGNSWSNEEIAALAAHVYLKDLGLNYPHHGDILDTLINHEYELHVISLPRLTFKLDLSGFLDDVTHLLHEQQGGQNEQNDHNRRCYT